MPNIDRVIDYIEFHDDVPEDVVQRFEDVKSVLDVARDNRRMLRVALEYTMTTVELALRLLCERVGHEVPMRKESDENLDDLLDYLYSNGYLPHRVREEPVDDPISTRSANGEGGEDEEESGSEKDAEENDLPGLYQALRDVRNTWIHTRDAGWYGWSSLSVIPEEVEFINRLFDAPKRRKRQRKERKRVNWHCQRLVRQGAALETPDRRFLVHGINMLYCDMGEDPTTYYFAFWPLFELEVESGDVLDDRDPYLAKCTSWEVTDTGSLSLSTREGTSVLVDRELSDRERDKLEGWLEEAGRRRSEAFSLWSHPRSLRAFLLDLKPRPLISMQQLNWID